MKMKNKNVIVIVVLAACVLLYLKCSYVPVFNGIDISHHNRVDWESIKENKDIKFCYIKATEGKTFRDNMCSRHAKNARNNGLHVGLYHYFRTDVPAEQQFKNFKEVYDRVPSDLIPVIDVEANGNDFSNVARLNKRLGRLIELFEEEYGCKPIIYFGNFCCYKVLHTVRSCPIWLRCMKVYHFIPSTTIKQTAIVNNIDMNYCKDIDKIIL